MDSTLSTTWRTKKTKKSSRRLMWRVRSNESGELRLIPIRNEHPKTPQGGTIQVTLTLKILMGDKVGDVEAAIRAAGGTVSHIRGRLMAVEVPEESVEAVGDVLESFGCQWDLL